MSQSVADEALTTLAATIATWVDDPDSDVVYAEWVEDRWAIRMLQQVREATTVWFWVGERSLIAEAYVLPSPELTEPVYRQALFRNGRSFRAQFALDAEGAVILRSRLPVERVTSEELSYLIAEIYEAVELSFRPMLEAGRQRENDP
jgi:hypothetical protein